MRRGRAARAQLHDAVAPEAVLDVLDAEQELFSAQVNLVSAQRDRAVSVYNLLLSIGELTLPTLGVTTEMYDDREHLKDVKWQLIGF